MKKEKNHEELLEEIFNTAWTSEIFPVSQEYKDMLDYISEKAEVQKGVYTVLLTLFTHKIINPKQDIRRHQSSIEGGFSGRTIDAKYITPTLKRLGLPSMAESGWLTRSLEQNQMYDKNYRGKISDSKLKRNFLEVIDAIEKNPNDTWNFVVYFISRVKRKFLKESVSVKKIEEKEFKDIDYIVSFFEKSFDYKTKGSSKIPVIALHSIFHFLIEELILYKNCTLKPLGSHTASDRTSETAGDIEIFDNTGKLREAIEVKHGRAIDSHLMRIIKDKIYKHNPKRYCAFSSEAISDSDEVFKIKREIFNNHGCQVIINGIIPTIKYYLRLISSKGEFINTFMRSIVYDKELTLEHKRYLENLFLKHFSKNTF